MRTQAHSHEVCLHTFTLKHTHEKADTQTKCFIILKNPKIYLFPWKSREKNVLFWPVSLHEAAHRAAARTMSAQGVSAEESSSTDRITLAFLHLFSPSLSVGGEGAGTRRKKMKVDKHVWTTVSFSESNLGGQRLRMGTSKRSHRPSVSSRLYM